MSGWCWSVINFFFLSGTSCCDTNTKVVDYCQSQQSLDSMFKFIMPYIAHLQQECHNSKFVIFQQNLLMVLRCYIFLWVQRRHNCSPAASFSNCLMTLYLLTVHLQTFLSIPITQKYQILSCDTLVANERYVYRTAMIFIEGWLAINGMTFIPSFIETCCSRKSWQKLLLTHRQKHVWVTTTEHQTISS